MSTPRFDLIDILQVLRRRQRMILIVTLVAAVLGGILALVRKDKYKSQAHVILSNPLYTDRNNLFRANEMRFVDYFGGDDDADRILVIAESDTVREKVARKLNLDKAYKLDLSDPEDRNDLKYIFKKNFEVKRTEFKTCELTFVDTDPKRAAAVVNEVIVAMEDMFRGYYVHMRVKASGSIQNKVKEIDSTILVLTDTLAALRDHYQIYDILSPGRLNVISGSIKSSGAAGFGKGMEQIQNIEAIKDQLVTDRAKYASLLNEFSTGNANNDMSLVHVITPAVPPVEPKGFGVVLTAIACALVGFFFCALYILLITYYRLLVSVER